MRQKDIIRCRVGCQQCMKKPMGQFGWVAKRGIAMIDTLFGRGVGDDRFKPQLSKKTGIKRVVGIYQKTAVKTDTAPAIGQRLFLSGTTIFLKSIVGGP